MDNKDVTIIYQGGSGGFALYYYLLLTGQYQFTLDRVKSMIDQQFPAELKTCPAKWKNNEFWPNNQNLKTHQGKKLFLICNPLFDPAMYDINQAVSKNTHKILLYTDLRTQLRMAYEKKAYWFTDVSRVRFNASKNNKKYLRSILDSGVEFEGELVDPQVPAIIEQFKPCELITLTKLVNNSSGTTDQQDFINYWKSIQSKKSLLKLA